jgi:Na+-transporting methylmalonyl-CoA/oxaloacetate decarboxylase gamma subunit
MNGLTAAVTTYIIAIIISFFVAGLLQLMGAFLTRFSKDKDAVSITSETIETSDVSSNEAAIATVIVIAKNNQI